MSVTLILAEPASSGGLKIEGRALSALRHSRIPALRKLRVEESSTAVTILGRVTSYHLKQLAQETVMPVLAARELHNEVLVVR